MVFVPQDYNNPNQSKEFSKLSFLFSRRSNKKRELDVALGCLNNSKRCLKIAIKYRSFLPSLF